MDGSEGGRLQQSRVEPAAATNQHRQMLNEKTIIHQIIMSFNLRHQLLRLVTFVAISPGVFEPLQLWMSGFFKKDASS